jgi:hypothetical protein
MSIEEHEFAAGRSTVARARQLPSGFSFAARWRSFSLRA